MTSYLQVITTVDSEAAARGIASALVEKRLAACVQVLGPLTSIYRWQGQIETSSEWLCLIKTRADVYDRVEEAIRELHPYEVPEILALPVAAGSRSYLDWLDESVGGDS